MGKMQWSLILGYIFELLRYAIKVRYNLTLFDIIIILANQICDSTNKILTEKHTNEVLVKCLFVRTLLIRTSSKNIHLLEVNVNDISTYHMHNNNIKGRRSLLAGVYARGSKRSHLGGKCVTYCGPKSL